MGLAQQIHIRGAARKAVGLGQELPLRVDSRCSEPLHQMLRRLGQGGHDIRAAAQREQQILHPPAIDDGEGMQQHLAAHEFVEQRARRGAGFDLVLTGLDGGGDTLEARVQDPRARLCDHSLRCEVGGHMRESRIRREL